MLEAKIIKTGRGPEIVGTRITVYDVIEYYKAGEHRDMIAAILSLSSDQVEAADPIHRGASRRGDGELREKHGARFAGGTRPSSRPGSTPIVDGCGMLRELRASRIRHRRPRMKGILADINVVAQAEALLSIWTSNIWREFWDDLDCPCSASPRLGSHIMRRTH